MKNKKVLFITEKYCDAKIEFGLTNSYHNIFGSYKNCSLSKDNPFFVVHYDETIISRGIHINTLKEKILQNVKPDIIVCTLLGNSPLNPDKEFFRFFRDNGVKVVFIWPDIGTGWGIKEIKEFDDVCDKHVSWASEKNVDSSKIEWMWTPEDPKLFYYDDKINKDIDVCFLGTVHNNERYMYLNYLKQNGINIFVSGGQRQAKLSAEQYAELTRRSKIVINFPFSPSGGDQLKGRIFEATACGALLFERRNEKIKPFYNESEYVAYDSPPDLLEKCKFYLENENKRFEIAMNGLNKYNSYYSSEVYWNKFFSLIQD